jgi:hypothetical protein
VAPTTRESVVVSSHRDAGRTFEAGWILVAPEAVKTKRQLGEWVMRGVGFARTLPPKG